MKIYYRAALGFSGLGPDEKATRSEVIALSMQASGNFPDSIMTISYIALAALKVNVHNAVVAYGRGEITAEKMHEEERALVNAFNFVRSLVEKTANDSADAQAVILSAGMTVITLSGNTPVTELTLSALGDGTIQVCVPRNKGEVSFAYYYSSDGINWIEFEISKLATVELTNQTPAAILHFRFAPVGKKKGAFSAAKTIIVL